MKLRIKAAIHKDSRELDWEELNSVIIRVVTEKFGGKAWFNAGSYSYLINSKTPNTLMTSDGGKIRCKNIAKTLKRYSDSGCFELDETSDDLAWEDILDYKLSPVKSIRNQEDHELRMLRGD